MSGRGQRKLVLCLLFFVCSGSGVCASNLDRYYAHEAVEDADGVIAPWNAGANGPLDERARIAVEVYKRYPWVGTDKAVMAAPDFVYNSHWSINARGEIEVPPTTDWMCGDLSQRAWSIVKGLTDYYRYSGDPVAFLYIPLTVDYILDYAQTPDNHPWPRFPISTPTNGKAYGRCDPKSRIQLDLCARVGEDVLRAYQLTGEERYFEAAKHWGDVFAEHCRLDGRAGAQLPPWDRYVDPSEVGWSDKLTGSTTMILEFLDALIRLGYTGEDEAIVRARDAGVAYVRDTLLPAWTVNDTWGRQYWDWDNPVMCGIVSMCGDYMLEQRRLFPNWKNDLRNMLTLVMARNGADPGSSGDAYSGAWAFPESCTCCGTSLSYNQYTAGPTLIRYGLIAGDARLLEIGRRMMIMAAYDTDENGVVKDGLFGETIAAKEWSNLAHPWPLCQAMEAIAWMPEEFAPRGESHIVRSASVVTWVEYGKGRVEYRTFAAPPDGVDVLRLAFQPAEVFAGGQPLARRDALDGNGYTLEDLDGDWLMNVRHDNARHVKITGEDTQTHVPAAEMTLKGAWEVLGQSRSASSSEQGAMAALKFSGDKVRVTGRVDERGGQADVYLDGRKQNTVIECWNPQPRERHTLYARSGLMAGEHTLEIVVSGKANPLSGGTGVHLQDVYSSQTPQSSQMSQSSRPETQRMIFGYLGREDYVDSQGHCWRPATEFVVRTGYGTDVVEKALWTTRRTMHIGKTPDPELYRYGIHGREFWANITVEPGDHYVRLLFASTPLHPFLEKDPDGGVTRYVQDVLINGEKAMENADIARAAGGTFRALVKEVRNVRPRHGIIEVRVQGRDGREGVLQAVEVGPMPPPERRKAAAKPDEPSALPAPAGPLMPEIDGEWWPIAGNPDLGPYATEKQEPVDFAVWQAADGTWQLWSCIRGTGCGGHTRLFYGWESDAIDKPDWTPKGIKMEARPDLGEAAGGLQAPHVVRWGGLYWMAYGDWSGICFATSEDGKRFERVIQPHGGTRAFTEGPKSNARDAMLVNIGGLWHCYYTAIRGDDALARGYGFCRTSADLRQWGPSCVVSYGGKVGNGNWNNECPHVVEVVPGGYVYFRNEYYGEGQRNWQYWSDNPLDFGIDNDAGLLGSLPIAAPEIVKHDDQWYIAALNGTLDGIRMARLKWKTAKPQSE